MAPPRIEPDSVARRLERSWWQARPGLWQWCLSPLSLLYGGLMSLRSLGYHCGLWRQVRLPIPVVVVGNYIVGGAGKTPTTIALVRALQALGWRPGVVSRGYGRDGDEVAQIDPRSSAEAVGDEPLLIFRQTRVPVAVGRLRAEAAAALMAKHPGVNVIVAQAMAGPCPVGLCGNACPRVLRPIPGWFTTPKHPAPHCPVSWPDAASLERLA